MNEITDHDRKHIARIKELRDSGEYNMFTEFYAGLRDNYSIKEAETTYEWVKENWEYFQSGDWTEVETRKAGQPLPELSDREVIQLMAAQMTLMDHHEQLDAEYKENIKKLAERYGVDHELLEQ